MLNPTIRPPTNTQSLEIGDHAFLVGGEEEIGAVRSIGRDALVIYVEGAGDSSSRAPRSAPRATAR